MGGILHQGLLGPFVVVLPHVFGQGMIVNLPFAPEDTRCSAGKA